ncbi:MAG: M48 family metallopeptidase [Clostridia bacterium]|nr:M48 family metallopeptidase [Clostridia bacterium]
MEKKTVKEIWYNNEKIECTIIKSKIKNVYIQIKDGKAILKAPNCATDKLITELLEKRKKWIYENIKRQKNNKDRTIDLVNKNYLYILDEKVNIKYKYKEVNKIEINIENNECIIVIPTKLKEDKFLVSKLEKKLDEKLKEVATFEIEKAINKYGKLTGLYPKSVTIRKFKRIWGNCSSKKDIKINQNVIFYGREEIEYVCLHEMAHLKYMNHQKEFWAFIKKYMPDYKERVKKLKQN